MDIIAPLLFFLVVLFLITFSSYLISRKLFRTLKKNENKYAMPWSAALFTVVFALISGTIIYIIVANMEFGR